MTTQTEERRPIPADTFRLRLVIARLHAHHRTAESAGAAVGVSGQAWLNWEKGDSDGAQKPAMLHYIAQQMNVDEDWLRDGGPLSEQTDDDPSGGGATRELHECLIDHSDDALTRLIAAQWRDPESQREAA
jgi:transcriptional regulator with XRE-family HTH domain